MDLVSIGEFARLSRLSPKALRLYDDLGLLPPARVDPDTGYRWYAPAQAERASIVALLRQVGMPLARIQVILGLKSGAAAAEISAYWASAEAEHAARRDLVGYLVDRLNGKRPVVYNVAVRQIPERQVLCRHRHATAEEVFALGKEFITRLGPVVTPGVADPLSAPFIIYYGQVSQDSDGPVEWCWPVPDDRATDLAVRFPDLALRTEPAHEEAFIHLPTAQVGEAQGMAVVAAMMSWVADQHRSPAAFMRQIFIRQRHPGDGRGGGGGGREPGGGPAGTRESGDGGAERGTPGLSGPDGAERGTRGLGWPDGAEVGAAGLSGPDGSGPACDFALPLAPARSSGPA